MDIALNAHETEVIRRALVTSLADLRMEIADTDLLQLRESLKADEAAIKSVLAKLGVTHPFGAVT